MTHEALVEPCVSIIMPAYNVERFISNTIKSVQSQTFQNFELIVIDDGSTDLTYDLVAAYAENDSRIKAYSQLNLGPSSARNRGIDIAAGRYIYFFDSDDFIRPEMLEICIRHMNYFCLDLVTFSGNIFFDEELVPKGHFNYQKPDILEVTTGQDLMRKLIEGNAYTCSPCLYLFDSRLLSNPFVRFDDGYIHEDEGFTPLLFGVAHRAISLKNILFMRRIRRGSIMTKSDIMVNVEGRLRAAVKIGQFCDSGNRLEIGFRKILRTRQKRLLRYAAHTAEKTGEYKKFVGLVRITPGLLRLFQMDPMALFYIGLSRLYFWLRAITRRSGFTRK